MRQHSALNRGIMFEWLKDLDDTGDRCPSDEAIMERFDFDTPEQARTLLADLADKGLITVKGSGPDRVVTIRSGAVAVPRAPTERPIPSVVKPQPDVEAMTHRILDIVNRTPSVVSPAPRPVAPAPALEVRPAAVTESRPRKGLDLGVRRQVNIKVSAEHYTRLLTVASAENSAISAVALRIFELGMDGPSEAPEPIHKPLIRAHVIRAARDAGIPIEDFVAGLIECGLQRFLADATRELAA